MPDDGSLAAEQLSGREIVTKALELLRANYVFPEQAEQAATAIEARLEAGEYDNLDEITLTELLTSHLQESPTTGTCAGGSAAVPVPARSGIPNPRSPRTTRPSGWPCGSGAAGQLRHPPRRAA